jgi:hypothetical protein
MNDGQSRPRQENNMTNLNRDLLNFHPSERAAMRKLQEQKANEPQIIIGKFWGTERLSETTTK